MSRHYSIPAQEIDLHPALVMRGWALIFGMFDRDWDFRHLPELRRAMAVLLLETIVPPEAVEVKAEDNRPGEPEGSTEVGVGFV